MLIHSPLFCLQVISYSSSASSKEEEYREKLEDIFSEQTWFETIFQLADALLRYMVALSMFPWQPPVPEESQKDIGRFSVLCLEVRERGRKREIEKVKERNRERKCRETEGDSEKERESGKRPGKR